MTLEITVGPGRLAIDQGYGVLITDHDGQIRWPTAKASITPALALFRHGESSPTASRGNS